MGEVDRELLERRRAIVRAYSDLGEERWKNFVPDFRLRLIGTTPVSGTMIGVDGMKEKMIPFGARLASLKVTVDDVIAEGDKFVKIARSEGVTHDGQRYRNDIATVFTFVGDKVVDVVEYLDTAMIERLVTGQDLDQSGNLAEG